MTADGGGWTMLVRLNTNDATSRTWGDTAFWNSNIAVGALSGTDDHLSAGYLSMPFTKIRLSYSYQGPGVVAASYENAVNADTLRTNLNRASNNANPAWSRTAFSGSRADEFFGPVLRFQTSGNSATSVADYSRIWYNFVSVNDCNQGGSIGHHGDYAANNWTWEVARGSSLDPGGCQHNTYKLGLGTNYNPVSWGKTAIEPSAWYYEGVMRVFVQ